MMDWLVLLLLTPLILIPVVFLSGFAGCKFEPRAAPCLPAAPSDLVATPIGIDRIDLTWTDNSTNASHFRIRRSDDGGATFLLIGETRASDPKTYSDSEALTEATDYQYQVFAFLSGCGETAEGSENPGESTGSNIASAKTLGACFDQGPSEVVGENENPPPLPAVLDGFCLIQRIGPDLLKLGGPKVRLRVRGSTEGDLQLNAVFISQGFPPGTSDPFDSANDLVPVRFGGSGSVLLPAGEFAKSDETDYALEEDKPLIVAFDIGTPGNARHRSGVTGAQVFSKASATEAGVSDRSGFQGPQFATVFIVERIDVRL